MLNVSPRQLQVFVETVAAGSLSAAADRLHLTQPAASMALAEMERLLGVALFDRAAGRLRLNARGRELLPLAQELLERHGELGRVASGRGRQLSGVLRIGTSNTVGNYRVGELLAGFVAAAPQVSVRLVVDNTERIVQAMLAHELDVGCVEGPVLQPELEWLPWRQDALLVCAPPGHPLAARRSLRAADFAGVAWVIREAGSATRGQTEQVLARLPSSGRRLELSQTEAIKQAVIAGLGIGLLPEVAVQDALATRQLCALPVPFLAPLLIRPLALVLRRDGYRGALLEAFLRATIQIPPSHPPEPPCSPAPTRLPLSTPNWPRPSPPRTAARKTMSS